jgi:hypothetical protein
VADRAKKAAAILCKCGVSFHFRAHDLRRTAASSRGEAGVDRFHIAHVLNHRSVTHRTVTAKVTSIWQKNSGKKPRRKSISCPRSCVDRSNFVKGDQRDVDDLIGKLRRSTASDVEARAR